MEMRVKNKEKKEGFDSVKTFRAIKENISKDIWGLSYEELMKYFENAKQKTVSA